MIGLQVRIGRLDSDRLRPMFARGERNALTRFGALVCQWAMTSIRPARQKPLSELPSRVRHDYLQRLALFRKGLLRSRPKRPLAHSRPGEPPRSVTGLLKHNIFFEYDPQAHSVVIGPAVLPGIGGATVLTALEFGGTVNDDGHNVFLQPRPFMRPAFDAELPHVLDLWP